MQIKSFKDLPAGLCGPQHKAAVPVQARTPKPERNKVVSIPTRLPINKQAALGIAPIRCHLSQPLPPEKLPNPYQKELDEARAELKIERNSHAETRDNLGKARQTINDLRDIVERLQAKCVTLAEQDKAKADVIRQLEDLRL